MKTIAKYLAMITLTASSIFTSCVSKKMQASNAQIEQLKKDSIQTHRKLNELLALAKEKKVFSEPHSSIVESKNTHSSIGGTNKSHSSTTVINREHFTPLPPIDVATIFNTHFPYATEVVWTEEIHVVKMENKGIKKYKATFVIQERKNLVIYSENGELIENRAEIMPEQLPQNIYEAIHKKYPEMAIVSASTYKNCKINGTYTATIRAKSHTEEKEVILMENGLIVEK